MQTRGAGARVVRFAKSGACVSAILRDKTYSFRAFLQADADEKELRKGNRTESRIKWCTCELLENTRLSDLKIQDVCARAEIAQGTFYLYFADKYALLNVVLREYVAFLKERMTTAGKARASHEEAVRKTTLAYYRLFEQNRGLMKCIISYYEDFPEISPVAAEMNRAWITLNVRSVQRRLEAKGRPNAIAEAELFRRCYALGGMVDQYLSYVFLAADSSVVEFSRDPEEVVETLSHIWINALKG
jgi:TetR/AcrR family transcriptional regulator, ethionamide resistance regulator